MATDINKLPNEVSTNNVVMNVSEKIPPNKKISAQKAPVAHPTELSQESIHQIVQGLQQAGGSTMLQNRDIPIKNNHITQDEEIKPNYIPKTDNTDYIENAADMDALIQTNKNKKTEQDRLDTLYNELQTPLLVMVLFFFFQLPFFNKYLVKHMPSLFSRDGNPTFTGYLLKTVVFGVSFYVIMQTTKQISEI